MLVFRHQNRHVSLHTADGTLTLFRESLPGKFSCSIFPFFPHVPLSLTLNFSPQLQNLAAFYTRYANHQLAVTRVLPVSGEAA